MQEEPQINRLQDGRDKPEQTERLEHRMGRRSLMRGGLAAGIGTAVVLGAAVATRTGIPVTGSATEFALMVGTDTASQLGFINVKAAPYNAIGDGNTDDTNAVNAAYNAAVAAKWPLYFPPGLFKVTSLPQFVDYTTVFGAGADLTTILYQGTGTLLNLTNRQRVAIKNLGFWHVGTSGTLINIANCFRCSFESVVIRGSHTSANNPTYLGQVGVNINANSGGTTFLNCDINNFGTGMVTSAIQNYITNCKFATNWIGLRGTGNNFSAGMAIANTEFVSDVNPKTTTMHILIDGKANDWWLTNVWFEGADIAVSVGNTSAGGGPAQFGMVNCQVAARSVCVDLQYCRQPYLANIGFYPDQGATPLLLRINAPTVLEGTAINLISSQAYDIPLSVFPVGWTVIGRNKEVAAGGPMLRSANGHAWKLQVSNTGVITAADQGVL